MRFILHLLQCTTDNAGLSVKFRIKICKEINKFLSNFFEEWKHAGIKAETGLDD